MNGGGEALGNSVALRLEGEWKNDFPNAKVLTAHLKEGEAYCVRSGGGGGFGPAVERPAEIVAEDVKQGYVSIESAEEYYGVVIDPETFEPDLPATEKRRKEMG